MYSLPYLPIPFPRPYRYILVYLLITKYTVYRMVCIIRHGRVICEVQVTTYECPNVTWQTGIFSPAEVCRVSPP